MMSTETHYNTTKWIEENKSFFLPPVCNKMMYSEGQMKVFFVGGPNQRKDYHLEEGEELFYQIKGDMVLKVFERNQPKDIRIKEGEVFLLPSNINHSPQRFENTVGLVVERERIRGKEQDGLRYFVENGNAVPTTNPLYEEWFYCDDLGTQLGPVIKRFFASEQFKTGKSIPGTVSDGTKPLPCPVNTEITLDAPFSLNQWLADNEEEIRSIGIKSLFDADKWQSKVFVVGSKKFEGCFDDLEVFCLQLRGKTNLKLGNCGTVVTLDKDDSFLIKAKENFVFEACDDSSRCLVYYQDPKAKK